MYVYVLATVTVAVEKSIFISCWVITIITNQNSVYIVKAERFKIVLWIAKTLLFLTESGYIL